jgi:hypothetical protein
MNARDNKGGGCDIVDTECIPYSLNKNSFTCTEWAVKKDEIASYALCTDALAESMHIGSCRNSDHLLRVKEREGLVSQTLSFTLSYY